jgi:AcrR family transcriptional regulator
MVTDGGRSGSRARTGSKGQPAKKKPAAKSGAGRPATPANGKDGLVAGARAPGTTRSKKSAGPKATAPTNVAVAKSGNGSPPEPKGPIGVPASKRALRSQGRETMQKLLDAAMEAFDRRGYHATRVNDVVDIANMSHGTFYLYFSNMSDLVRALTIEVATSATELYGALTQAGTALDGESREHLRQWIGDYSKLWLRYAPLFRSWTDLATVDDSVADRTRRTLSTLTDAMSAQISAAGMADDLSPEVTGLAVLAMLDRFHYLRDFMGQPVDDEALETLTTMVHRALFTPVEPDRGHA